MITEQLRQPNNSNLNQSEKLQDIPYPPGSEKMLEKRNLIAEKLIKAGQLTRDFVNSGALDCFRINPVDDSEAVSHILIGDITGGAHHLPSIMTEGMPVREVASKTYSESKKKTYGRLRYAQKVRPENGGIFYAKHVLIEEAEGDIIFSFTKPEGSDFFPSEWTAEDVLTAAIEVSQIPAKVNELSKRYGTLTHEGEVKGVKLTVYTDPRTGRITSAHPS